MRHTSPTASAALRILRVPLAIGLGVLLAIALGGAAIAGRSVPATLVAVELAESRPEYVAYMLIDVGRGLATRHALDVPYGVDARWWALPPLVLQRVDRFEFADWTLSSLDLHTNMLSPLMYVTTPNNARIRTPDTLVRSLPDGRWHVSVYVPLTGDIWVSTSDAPHAELLASVERHLSYPLQWSPDGTQLAVKSNEYAGLTLIDADGGNLRTYEAPSNTWIAWSPDSSKILISPVGLISGTLTIDVLDTRTGAYAASIVANYGTWCGSDRVAYLDVSGGGSASLAIGDALTGAAEPVAMRGLPSGFELSTVMSLHDNTCDWLVVTQRRRGDAFLLHVGTGRVLPLGIDLRVVDRGPDTLTFVVLAGDEMELRRIALDPETAGFETLARYPRTFADVRWLDGWEYGLFLDYKTLALLNARNAEWDALTAPIAQAFAILE